MRALTALAVLGGSPAALAADAPGDEDGSVVVEDERTDPSDPRQAAASVTVVAVDDRLPEDADVADAVARAPGTTVRRLGGLGTFSAVSLRGAALRQVEVHLDGIPLNPDGSAAVDLSALPLRALDRVEVWRGGGPAWMAAAPLGGVVDLHTAEDARAPLSLSAGAGSWSTVTASARGATVTRGVEVLGAASALASASDFVYFDDNGTDGVRTDDRLARRTDNDRRQAGGLLRLRGGAGGGRWTGLLVGTAREEGLPGPVGAPPEGRLLTGWTLAAVQREGGRGATTTTLRGWGQGRLERRERPEVDGPLVDRIGQAGLHAGARHLHRDDLVLGATGRLRLDGRGTGGPLLDPRPAHRWTATGALDAAWWPVARLRIEPVLHGQVWRDVEASTGVWSAAVSPRLAAAWRPHDDVIVHAAGGRAVRPPDFLERFGDRGAVVGRRDLRPERGTWADAGLRWIRPTWRAEVGAFHHAAIDRIIFVQNAQRTLVPVNVGRSRATGVEAAVDGAPTAFLDARLAATLTDTRVSSDTPGLDGKRLPRIPLASATADLAVHWEQRLRLTWMVDAVTGNAWDEANLAWAAPRLLHGLSLRVAPRPRWPSLSVDVRNVGDRLAQVVPADRRQPQAGRVLRPLTDFAGYPLPGRTVLVTLRWTPRETAP